MNSSVEWSITAKGYIIQADVASKILFYGTSIVINNNLSSMKITTFDLEIKQYNMKMDTIVIS